MSTKMARDVEWTVRETLNQYLTLSWQHRLSRRGRLVRLLDQHPGRPQLIALFRPLTALPPQPGEITTANGTTSPS